MKTFKEAYLSGEATEDDLEGWIDQWHEGYQLTEYLHETLGMSYTEYCLWATTPSELASILWTWKASAKVKSIIAEHQKGAKTPYDNTSFLTGMEDLFNGGGCE